MTAALEGGEWSAGRPGRTLPPGKDPVPILEEAGWTPGPVWMSVKSRPVLNTVGNCNTVASVIILYYNIMGPPSYMRSVVDRNVVMRRMTV